MGAEWEPEWEPEPEPEPEPPLMPRYTPLAEQLPSTVPFVGPETQERARGKPFAARLGANVSPTPPAPRTSLSRQASP